MKILIDMNLSPRWVNSLTNIGIEAAHWINIGAANAPDTVIMEYAKVNDFSILTHDLDFSAILAVSRTNKPSVIQLRTSNISPESSADLVIRTIRKLSSDIEKGAIVTVDDNKIRLHFLPL